MVARETQSLEHYNETAKYKIAVVRVSDLEFLKKNARYMSNDQFRNLVDSIYAKMTDYERFLDAQTKIQAAYNVHNGATSVMVLLDIFESHYEDLLNGWTADGELLHKNVVPLCSILGTDYIPAELGMKLKKVVDVLVSKSEISKAKRYEALEKLIEKWSEE